MHNTVRGAALLGELLIAATGLAIAGPAFAGEALSLCRAAVMTATRDPEKTDAPYVPTGCNGTCVNWDRTTHFVRGRNGFGADVPVEVHCVVANGTISYFKFGEHVLVDLPGLKPPKDYGTGRNGFEAWARDDLGAVQFRYPNESEVLIALGSAELAADQDGEKLSRSAADAYEKYVGHRPKKIKLYKNNQLLAVWPK